MSRKCMALSCPTSEENIFQLFELPKDQVLKKNEVMKFYKALTAIIQGKTVFVKYVSCYIT